MGKTTLVRWLQEEAERGGFATFWGFGLKEVSTPFFPFQQMFRSLADPATHARSAPLPSPLPPVVIFEEERPSLVFQKVAPISGGHPTLVVGREREEQVREHGKGFDASTTFLRLSRGGGSGSLPPSDVDAIGHRARDHLERAVGSFVVLTGVEYLVSQSGFPSVLRLLEFLRDAAQECEGHVFLSLNPQSLEPRQAPLLEAEGEVVHALASGGTGPVSSSESAPAVMIRYLDSLEHESPRRPILLLVDDLQWADPTSLRAFQFLARNVRALRVMIVATYRTDDIRAPDEQKDRSLKEMLAATEQEGTLHRMPLRGLDVGEVIQLAGELFGRPTETAPGDPGMRELMARSEGNPYFLKESLRRLAEEGFVEPAGTHLVLRLQSGQDSPSRGPKVPPTLQRLVERRLEMLGAEERDVLAWAAVAGSLFDLAPLEGVIPPGPRPLATVLEGLSGRHHLVDSQGPGQWSFGHPLVWEVTLLTMGEEEHHRRAARLGEWWAARRPDDTPTVARLFHEAAEPSPGLPWTRSAILGAIRSQDLESVERFHDWHQDLLRKAGAGDARRAQEALEVVEQMCAHFGNSAEAVRILRALSTLEPGEELARARDDYLALNLVQTSPREAARLVEQGLRRSGPTVGVLPLARGVLGLAATVLAAVEGRFPESEKIATPVLASGEELPVWVKFRLLYYVGSAQTRRGLPDEARATLRVAWELAERSGYSLLMGYCRSLEAFIAETCGELGENRKSLEAAVEIARTALSPVYLCIALLNVGTSQVLQGDLPAAIASLSELRKQSEHFRVERARRVSVPHLEAYLAIHQGRPADALAPLESASRYVTEKGDVEILPELDLSLAEARLDAGLLDGARELLRSIRAREQHLQAYLRPRPFLLEGRVAGMLGDAAAARERFEAAREIARQPENLLNLGLVAVHLAAWEDAFGQSDRASALRKEAHDLFDRSGVFKEAWVRKRPAPFPPRPAP